MKRVIKFSFLFCIGAFLAISYSCHECSDLTERYPYNLAMTQTKEQYKKLVNENPSMKMINIRESINSLYLDIRYATKNNFTGEVIYTAPEAYARKPVAEALDKVQDSLAYYHLAIKIYDAYRPYSATLKFYEVYPDTNFVANPRYGSRHNRGCAIDLTLVERSTGKEISMPTEFDDFREKAHPDYRGLSDTVIANRTFLFNIMAHFGFTHYPTEWWHFDFTGWEDYSLMDLAFDQL